MPSAGAPSVIEKFLVRVKYGSWNRWRDDNPDAAINLDGANLDGMILGGINLSRASLRGASFRESIAADLMSVHDAPAELRLAGVDVRAVPPDQ